MAMPTLGRFRYLEAVPNGRPHGTLVLIHGFPLNAHMWEEQLEPAEHGWRVIAPQLRGFDSDGTRDPAAASVDDYAGDVIDLMDGLHVHEAVIGGLSMGGYIAFAIFRHAPSYVRGLVLADTRSQADAPAAVQSRDEMRALALSEGAAAVADQMIPRLLGDTTKRERPDIVDRTRGLILVNSPQAIAGALVALKTRPDSTPLLESIRCPTLVVVGDEDTLTPPELSEGMQRAIAGAELVRIPRAGHMSNIEQPQEFNRALARFLAHRV
jgi:pimeloyl-ACP methyl ester carboxylesterase